MEFDYEFTRKDSKEFWKNKHWKTNFLYLGLFTVAFIALNYMLLPYNIMVFLGTYLFYVIILLAILLFINGIFTFFELKSADKLEGYYGTFHYIVDEKGITKKMQPEDLTILWEKNPRVKLKKHWIVITGIVGKERLSLLFYDESFKNAEDFHKLTNWFKERMKLVAVNPETKSDTEIVEKTI